MSIPNFVRAVEDDPQNYECLLTNLLKAEKQYHKTHKLSKKNTKSKFRRYISKCQGDEYSKIVSNLTDRWTEKLKTLKQTRYYPNRPKKGFITKITKMPSKDLILPYKPEEQAVRRGV